MLVFVRFSLTSIWSWFIELSSFSRWKNVKLSQKMRAQQDEATLEPETQTMTSPEPESSIFRA